MNGAVLLSVDDLDLEEIGALLRRAAELEAGAASADLPRFSVGLQFLAPSLRTRAGFAAATARLGGCPIFVDEPRFDSAMSAPESFWDSLRSLSGLVDVVVARTPFELDRGRLDAALAAPFLNGGDGDGEHPTQALIDLFAIERFLGPPAELRIAICGDMGQRCVRSLIRLLDRIPPRSLCLIAPLGRDDPSVPLSAPLSGRLHNRADLDLTDIDVLYMAGLPAGGEESRLPASAREPYVLTAQRLRSLPADAIVLSPLPVVDEISPEAHVDPRVRCFEQGDRGLFVRMAVLERILLKLGSQAMPADDPAPPSGPIPP